MLAHRLSSAIRCRVHSVTALTAALVVASPVARAQLTPNDLNFNWVNMQWGNSFLGGTRMVPGPALFGALTGPTASPNYAGPGDSIRVCYGIDSTQGGRNLTGDSEVTWFAVVQGHDNATPLNDIGLVSMSAATVDSLEGDACISPFFSQGIDSSTGAPVGLNARLNFAAIIGVFPGTTLGAGFFYTMYFSFIGSTGILGPTTIGTDASALPLISHLIYEIQGPVNGGPGDNQYYLASTSESLGVGDGSGNFTGGVTNGNGRHGVSVFGSSAQPTALGGSGALSHNRLTAYHPSIGLLGTTTVTVTGEEKEQLLGHVAVRTPMLWAGKQRRLGIDTGGGAPDWQISQQPVDQVTMRSLDVLSGAQGSSLAGGPPAPFADNPFLAANLPVFVFSASPAAQLLQQPFTWDDLGGSITPQPGNVLLGAQATSRAGFQTVPANLDILMLQALTSTQITIGANYAAAYSTGAGATSTLFEDGQGLGEGTAAWNTPGPVPLATAPNPALLGERIGAAAAGVQYDTLLPALYLTEFNSACTIVLQ